MPEVRVVHVRTVILTPPADLDLQYNERIITSVTNLLPNGQPNGTVTVVIFNDSRQPPAV